MPTMYNVSYRKVIFMFPRSNSTLTITHPLTLTVTLNAGIFSLMNEWGGGGGRVTVWK